MNILESLINYLIIFIVFYFLVSLIYKLFVLRSEEKVNKFLTNSSEVSYLKGAYKINIKKYNSKFLVKKMIMTNAIIMSLTVTFGFYSSNWGLSFLISFILLIPIMLIGYHILAKYLIKKGSVK